ncbi:MAG TPA: hypothetical protein DCL15_00890 [Chloroflexi bacterium]|nr:hypothetical protein [Chloroflexota bacterium]HHW85666.1 hypothetical protein [Chloroflexota bacterium]
MSSFAFELRGRARWLALLCILALSLTWPQPGLAHGGGAPQITDAPAGPYRLFAWSSPDPWRTGGAVHLTVAVTMVDASGQTMPISDATVTAVLMAEGQPASTVQLVATPNPTAAGFYEADGELPVAGVWRIEVLVSGAAGAGSGVFTTTVQPGASLNWVMWVGAGVGVLALVGIFALRQRSVHTKALHAQRA